MYLLFILGTTHEDQDKEASAHESDACYQENPVHPFEKGRTPIQDRAKHGNTKCCTDLPTRIQCARSDTREILWGGCHHCDSERWEGQ